jgi:hypothetical protein
MITVSKTPLDRPKRYQVGEAVVMRDARILTLVYDRDAGQTVLEGLPEGPAGGASLVPADGVELTFDCADGRLCRVTVDAGPGTLGDPAVAFLTSLFGPQVAATIATASVPARQQVTVTAVPKIMTALSRLSRLDAARPISQVPDSLLWAVEAAQLAAQAGLDARRMTETRQAAAALDGADDIPHSVLSAAAGLVADLIEAGEPELANRLRAYVAASPAPSPAPGPSGRPRWPAVPAEAGAHSSQDGAKLARLQWCLDPRLIPAGLFQHALWPEAELRVRGQLGRRLIVEAETAPGAVRGALATCRARLVDPGRRSVLVAAPFRQHGNSLLKADLPEHLPPGPGDAWVEVVDEESRPVLSGQLHRIRRAMRWADAALSIRRRSVRLADAGWARLEAVAWARCAEDWSAAADADRAYLAAIRRAAICPEATAREAPSEWARELAGQPALAEEPFLAELGG